jgi:hypothetical protein
MRHRTDESDSQPVASQVVFPNRIKPEFASSPNPEPTIVMLEDPVEALFWPMILLINTTSNEQTSVNVPDASPEVMTTLRVQRIE